MPLGLTAPGSSLHSSQARYKKRTNTIELELGFLSNLRDELGVRQR